LDIGLIGWDEVRVGDVAVEYLEPLAAIRVPDDLESTVDTVLVDRIPAIYVAAVTVKAIDILRAAVEIVAGPVADHDHVALNGKTDIAVVGRTPAILLGIGIPVTGVRPGGIIDRLSLCRKGKGEEDGGECN